MKKIIRITAAMLLCLCFAFLISCANSVENEEILPEYDTGFDAFDVDLHEYEYIIHAYSPGSSFPLNPTMGDSVDGDKVLERYRETEQKFNIKITPYNGVDTNMMATYLGSGLNYADLFYAQANTVIPNKYMQEGYLNSFTAMDLDFASGMYGSENALLANTFKDHVYGILAYYWNIPNTMNQPAMWFNPVVLNKFGQTSPHELDENGQWNWETLKQICAAVRDTTDSDKNMHTYALCYTNEPYLETAAIFSNNGRFIEPDANGHLRYAMNSPNVMEALDYLSGLVSEGLVTNGGDRQNITPFIEDRRAFFLEFTHLGIASESTSNFSFLIEHEFEWINFPRGPKGDENTISTSYSYYSAYFYSPISSPLEVNATVLPFLFQPLPGNTTEDYLDAFKSANFYSEESFEYYQRIREDAFFDYTPYAPFTSIRTMLNSIITGKSSASEQLASIETSVNTTLDSLYNNYLDN